MKIGYIALIIALILGVMNLTACAGPLLLGIKEYRGSDGSVTKFITGADFGLSLNGIDTVENVRGIRPESETERRRK